MRVLKFGYKVPPTPYSTLICLYITVELASGRFAGEQDGIPLESTRSLILALSDVSLTDQQADGGYRCWLVCISATKGRASPSQTIKYALLIWTVLRGSL